MKEYTLSQLQTMLNNGESTSLELCKLYLERINKYDGYLKSIGEINPDIESIAKKLDDNRIYYADKPLYGIPIVVKDNINTNDNMHTSAGTLSLDTNQPDYDATVVKKLREAGMIILGKANLSEFAYFMSSNAPCGFSSKFGQCKSPYRADIDPLGSSTGSAVAVAANLIPVSIGTETNGSLMSPAMANSIVSIKPTLGMVSRYGILPITSSQDTAGPMGRTVLDVAKIMDVIYGIDENDKETLKAPKDKYEFEKQCSITPTGMRVGLLSFDNRDKDEYKDKLFAELKTLLEEAENECIEVSIPESGINEDYDVLCYEFGKELDEYLETINDSKCKSLKEIIEFNKLDPQTRCPYGQDILEESLATSGNLRDPKYLAAKRATLEKADLLNQIMNELLLDALVYINPTSYSACGGYPSLAVPACDLRVDNPYSMIFLARKWDDEILFSLASYYESKTNYRKPPEMYLNKK